MDSSDVGGYFHIRGLRIGTMVHMNVLKSPRRVRSVVCEITHLYPQATFGPDWGGVLTRSDSLNDSLRDISKYRANLLRLVQFDIQGH